MNTERLSDPILITRPSALERMVELLASEPLLAVDTESNSLFAYQEKVCLIQFSTSRDDFLVDPLTLEDLSPLKFLFSNASIEKIFHAAEYDLISMKRDYGFPFDNLFDTMLAARILGWEGVGLGSILKAEFGVDINKRFQRANWGKRPLSPEMLAYARLDTHYLIPLRNRLKAELKSRDRWSLAKEDFSRLRYVNDRDPDEMPDPCWRVRGAYDLTPQQAAVLHELCQYRNQKAKALDRPLFKVLGDRTLVAIAEACPHSPQELQELPELSPRQFQRYSRGLLLAVKHGLRSEPLHPPTPPRPNDQYLARLEALRTWRKRTARQMRVKSDVVLPRDVLDTIAVHHPSDKGELSELMAQLPWRLERFGDQILATLSHA